ncbi:MAG: aminopeptidase P family protein [Armatimonadetes bacterium]|nr:aminopeptidase P family protein [Armatimonadota bacterium]
MNVNTAAEEGIGKAEVWQRIECVRAGAKARGFPGLVVIARSFYDRPGNIAYLTNHFPPFPTTQFWGPWQGIGHAVLILPLDGDPILYADVTVRRDLVAIDDCRITRNMTGAVIDGLKEKGLSAGRVGLVGDDIMPVTMYREVTATLPALTLAPADDLVTGMRMIKSPAEQRLMRKACAICDIGYGAAVPAVRDGARETDVCAAGVGASLAAGADYVRYLRTHSGPYSAWSIRWPQAMDRVMRTGEMVCLDLIGAYWGQMFDVLRTTVVGRKATDAQKRQLEAALAATRAAVAASRPGVVAEDLVRVANKVIEDAGFGKYARPFAGHGIGLEMDGPVIAMGDKTVLRPGMALCLEPGINIPDVGGASIEEQILVTDGDPEVLSKFETRLWE